MLLAVRRAARIEVEAGIADALRSELLLQIAERRVADRDHDALIDRVLDEIVKGGRARVAHDLDAARLGCDRILELVDHRAGVPLGVLRLEIDAERRGGRLRAVFARERRAVARRAAHLDVHRQPLAERLVGERRRRRQRRQRGCRPVES